MGGGRKSFEVFIISFKSLYQVLKSLIGFEVYIWVLKFTSVLEVFQVLKPFSVLKSFPTFEIPFSLFEIFLYFFDVYTRV